MRCRDALGYRECVCNRECVAPSDSLQYAAAIENPSHQLSQLPCQGYLSVNLAQPVAVQLLLTSVTTCDCDCDWDLLPTTDRLAAMLSQLLPKPAAAGRPICTIDPGHESIAASAQLRNWQQLPVNACSAQHIAQPGVALLKHNPASNPSAGALLLPAPAAPAAARTPGQASRCGSL